MPNGGVPLQMMMTPKDESPYFIFCHRASVHLYAQKGRYEETLPKFPHAKRKGRAYPLMTLTEEEAGALAWFIGYWLGSEKLRPGYDMQGSGNVEFFF